MPRKNGSLKNSVVLFSICFIVIAIFSMFYADVAEANGILVGSSGSYGASTAKPGGGLSHIEHPIIRVGVQRDPDMYLDDTVESKDNMIDAFKYRFPHNVDSTMYFILPFTQAISTYGYSRDSFYDGRSVGIGWYNFGSKALEVYSTTDVVNRMRFLDDNYEGLPNNIYKDFFNDFNSDGRDGKQKFSDITDAYWKSKLNYANDYAKAIRVWSYILGESDEGAGDYRVSEKINEYVSQYAEDVRSGELTRENKEDIVRGYLDLLLTMRLISSGTEAQKYWDSAISDYLSGAAMLDKPVALVIDLCVSVNVHPATFVQNIVLPVFDYIQYNTGVEGIYSLYTSKKKATTFYWPLSTSDGELSHEMILDVVQRSVDLSPNFIRISDVYDDNDAFDRGFPAAVKTKKRLTTANKTASWQNCSVLDAIMDLYTFAETPQGKLRGFLIAGYHVIEPSVDIKFVASPKEQVIAEDSETIGMEVELTFYAEVKESVISSWSSKLNSSENGVINVRIEPNGVISNPLYVSSDGDFVSGVDITKDRFMNFMQGLEPIIMYDVAVAGASIGIFELIEFPYFPKMFITYKENGEDKIVELELNSDYASFIGPGPVPFISYLSRPNAYSEIKEGRPYNETFEAMAGVPSTERLYFAVGGSEFIVDVLLEYVPNETSVWRTYRSYYTGVPCEFKEADNANNTVTGRTIEEHTVNLHDGGSYTHTWTGSIPNLASAVTVDGSGDVSATCSAIPDRTDYNNSMAEALEYIARVNSTTLKHLSASDKLLREQTGWNARITTDNPVDPVDVTNSNSCYHTESDEESSWSVADPCSVTASPSGAGNYTIVVTFDIPAHILCGPCCCHDLPALEDTWKQNISYDILKIIKAYVWKIDQGNVDGMMRLINTDEIKATIAAGNPNIFYNRAITESSKHGRLRYSIEPDQHDIVAWNEGSRTNKCNGLGANGSPYAPQYGGHTKEWATGILYDNGGYHSQFDWLDEDTPWHWTRGGVKTNITNIADDKDVDTAEWGRFDVRRTTENLATVIADMLILQTSSGDQSVIYFDKKSEVRETQQIFHKDAKLEITKEEMWDDNTNSASWWELEQINIGSYNGLFSRVYQKYDGYNLVTRLFPSGHKTKTKFDSYTGDATGTSINDPAKTVVRPSRSPQLFIYRDEQIIPTIRNKAYMTGVAEVFYKNILNYDELGEGTIYSLTLKSGYGANGHIIDAPYSDDHVKVNDIVVHTPVSVENAIVVGLDSDRDQRCGVAKGSADDIIKYDNALKVCPRDPGLCEFRVLNCKWVDTYDPADIPNLVAFYKLDCDLKDCSVKKNNGVLEYNGFFKEGYIGEAVSFNGVNRGYVKANWKSWWNNIKRGVTVSFWLNLTDYTQSLQLLVGRCSESDSMLDASFVMHLNGDKLVLSTTDDDGVESLYSTKGVLENQWVHCTGVIDRDNQTMKIYINGDKVAERSIRGSDIITNSCNLYIGNFDSELAGLLDEVRVYDKALLNWEIKRLSMIEGKHNESCYAVIEQDLGPREHKHTADCILEPNCDEGLLFNGVNYVKTNNNFWGSVLLPVDSASGNYDGDATISAWVTPTVLDSVWRSVFTDSNYNEGMVAISSSGVKANWGTQELVSGAMLTENKRSYITLVNKRNSYRNYTQRLYVDGYLMGQKTVSSPSDSFGPDANLIIGKGFIGKIENVRVWNISMSDSQVKASMDEGNYMSGNVKGYWDLKTCTSNTVYDSSTSNATATIIYGNSGIGYLVDLLDSNSGKTDIDKAKQMLGPVFDILAQNNIIYTWQWSNAVEGFQGFFGVDGTVISLSGGKLNIAGNGSNTAVEVEVDIEPRAISRLNIFCNNSSNCNSVDVKFKVDDVYQSVGSFGLSSGSNSAVLNISDMDSKITGVKIVFSGNVTGNIQLSKIEIIGNGVAGKGEKAILLRGFEYTGNVQTFMAPETGKYYLEVWGAQGGEATSYDHGYGIGAVGGGAGGYSKGEINLSQGDIIYVYVGGMGSAGKASVDGLGGYNGGGRGRLHGSGGGGGATDIRKGNTSLSSRVIVAGGGGGGQTRGLGYCAVGGVGGGSEGGNGGFSSYSGWSTYTGYTTYGGTQTNSPAANYWDNSPEYIGSLGQGGTGCSSYTGGGGGGYWGGNSGSAHGWSGGGGSGYIGGVLRGQTLSGCCSVPAPYGGSAIGRVGNGYAKISLGGYTNGESGTSNGMYSGDWSRAKSTLGNIGLAGQLASYAGQLKANPTWGGGYCVSDVLVSKNYIYVVHMNLNYVSMYHKNWDGTLGQFISTNSWYNSDTTIHEVCRNGSSIPGAFAVYTDCDGQDKLVGWSMDATRVYEWVINSNNTVSGRVAYTVSRKVQAYSRGGWNGNNSIYFFDRGDNGLYEFNVVTKSMVRVVTLVNGATYISASWTGSGLLVDELNGEVYACSGANASSGYISAWKLNNGSFIGVWNTVVYMSNAGVSPINGGAGCLQLNPVHRNVGYYFANYVNDLRALEIVLKKPANTLGEYDPSQGEVVEGEVRDFVFTGGIQQVTLSPGEYKLEAWGAQGGYGDSRAGMGGYSRGNITVSSNNTFYVVVGGSSGYNGGGSSNRNEGYGGGATHIAGRTGLLSALSSYKSDVVIVAGGGGGFGGRANLGFGGAGGGLAGIVGGTGYGTPGQGGTQTAGGAGGRNGTAGSFGQGGTSSGGSQSGRAGGGGGWYGGGGGGNDYSNHNDYDDSGGGGGSGYISGLQDGITIAGNLVIPNYAGGESLGNQGNGHVRITELISVSDGVLKIVEGMNIGGSLESGSKDFNYTGSVQNWQAPHTGEFKLEVWGAEGGTSPSYAVGGKGGYSVGKVNLVQGDSLYVYVGQKGVDGGSGSSAAFNGGAAPYNNHQYTAGGGGATDIRLVGGAWNVTAGLNSRIIVAGGGGGGGAEHTGGYEFAGAGGGLVGEDANSTYSGLWDSPNFGKGGTQTTAGGPALGGFGYGGKSTTPQCGSGGGGWYGGGGQTKAPDAGGGGGSGYVLTASSYKPAGYSVGEKYYLKGANTIVGNMNLPNPNGGLMLGRTGNGLARISWAGSSADMESIIDTILLNIDLIPSVLEDGSYNPLFTCGFLPLNAENEIKARVILMCSEPHHNGLHYDGSNSICWDACGIDENHNSYKPVVVTPSGDDIPNGTFVNMDFPFEIYFPNIGDFYQSNLHGISRISTTRGIGYGNNMNTTLWTRNKRVKFEFNVVYKEKLYLAGEWIELAVADGVRTIDYIDGSYDVFRNGTEYIKYDFYCVLANFEAKGAKIEYEVEAINCWGANDNKIYETNRKRYSDFTALHGAYRTSYIDVVGRIGNLVISDTEDYRFSNFFKEPLSPTEWLIEGFIKEVDTRIQKNYYGDVIDIRGKEAKDTASDKDFFGVNDNWSVASGGTKYLDTYGSQDWLHKEPVQLPIKAADNNIIQLTKEELRFGYDIYADISTIGNYYQNNLFVCPRYYHLNLENNEITPVDVYLRDDGVYRPLNLYNYDDSSDKDKMYEYVVNLDWVAESERRNYTLGEKAITDMLAAFRKEAIILDGPKTVSVKDDDGKMLYEVEIAEGEQYVSGFKEMNRPVGRFLKLGTAQNMLLTDKARTFIGSSKTYGIEYNLREEGLKIPEHYWGLMAQRWHFKYGVPSAAVFVESGVSPSKEEIDKIMNDKSVLLLTSEIYAKGDTFTLKYKQYGAGSITVAGRAYMLSGIPNDEAIIAVFASHRSSVFDVDITGTH